MMRFTIIQEGITISFVAPPTFLKALIAAACHGHKDYKTLLGWAARYDDLVVQSIFNGLAVFDERNGPENCTSINQTIELATNANLPVFKVVNEQTQVASLQPVMSGLIIINLLAQKIIQVQNSYAEIKRSDRGRVHVSGKPTKQLYYYELPEVWQVLP